MDVYGSSRRAFVRSIAGAVGAGASLAFAGCNAVGHHRPHLFVMNETGVDQRVSLVVTNEAGDELEDDDLTIDAGATVEYEGFFPWHHGGERTYEVTVALADGASKTDEYTISRGRGSHLLLFTIESPETITTRFAVH